jgi:ABC-type glycerol-3-phosphate transport system substrate-binding protein
MHRRALSVFTAAAVAAAVAAGCGGGDSSGNSPTKAEFVKQAETYCKGIYKDVQKQLAVAAQTIRENEISERKREELLLNTIILPTLQGQHDKLEEIGIPEGDEAQVEEILAALEKLIEQGEANPVGVLAQGDPFLDVDKQMKAYGIEACRH